jgi:hypothetical protein
MPVRGKNTADEKRLRGQSGLLKAYASTRQEFEPLIEMMQIRGNRKWFHVFG